MIRGDNNSLLQLRSSLENELIHSSYVSDGVVIDFQHAVDCISKKIQQELKCKISSLELDFHSKVSVCKNDIVCIVHDRDYHEYYFPNEMYDRAISLCESNRDDL